MIADRLRHAARGGDVSSGSNVHFAVESGHRSAQRQCPLRAKNGLTRRSKVDRLGDHLTGS